MRQLLTSLGDGSERYFYCDPSPASEGATLLELFLHLYNVGANGRARVLYSPSGDGSYFVSASQVIANQTAAGVYTGSKTSDLGARGRVIVGVSDSTSSAMVYVEAEVLAVWKR